MLNPVSIGVSLEPGRISAALLKETLFGMKVLDLKFRLLPQGSGAEETVGIINELLKDMVRSNRIRHASVSLGLPEDMATFRFVELPRAVKENLKGALQYELDKYIPVLPEEVSFDCQVVDEDRENAKIRVMLVVVKKKILEPFLDIGIERVASLSRIELASTALAAFMHHSGSAPKTGVFCILSASGSYSVFSAIEKGRVKHIAKIRTRSAEPADRKQVQRVIEDITETYGPCDVCYYPFPELSELSEQLLADSGVSALPMDISRSNLGEPSYIEPYGLGANAFGGAPNDINLLPDALQRKPSRMGFYLMTGLAGILVVSAMLYGGSLLYQKNAAVERVDTEIARLRQKIGDMGPVQKEYDRVASRLRYLKDFGGKSALIEMLTELSVIIPENTWIHEFRCSDGEIKIEGFSDSASELISLLEDSALFDNASFLSTIRKATNGKERFHIGVEIETD